MSSELMKKISGQLTDAQGVALSQLPYGVTIELNTLASPPGPGGWIGSAPIKTTGDYELFTAYNIGVSESVLYDIYKDDQPVKTGSVLVQNNIAANIALTQDEINELISPYMGGTVSISGMITLGDENVAGVPIGTQISVDVHKSSFKLNTVIATASIDINGKYCVKLPLNMLGLMDTGNGIQCCCPKSARFFISLSYTTGDAVTIIERTNNLDITDDCITVDIHTDNSLYFQYFKTEMDYVAANIHTITNVDINSYHSFTTDGVDSDLNAIIAESAMDPALINNMVYASKNAYNLTIALNHSYVLTDALGSDYNNWTSLSKDDITAYVNDGTTDHLIPAGGDVNDTYNKIKAKQTDIVYNSLTENGDTMGTVIGVITKDDTSTRNFLQLSSDYIDKTPDAFWAAVPGAHITTSVDALQKGMQILSITGLQPEMTNFLITNVGESKVADILAAKTTTEWYNNITTVCEANHKLCVPVSIRGNSTDYRDVAVKNAYAAKLYDLSTNTFATTVLQQRLLSDSGFAAKFRNPTAIATYLSGPNGFDLRDVNVWDSTAFKGSDDLKNDMLPLQNLVRLTEGKPDTVIQFIKDDIKSSSQIAAMPNASFVSKYSTIFKDDALLQKIYSKAVHTDMILKQTYVQLFPGSFTEKVTRDYSNDIWKPLPVTSPPAKETTPDLESLFGSMDFCACADCTSMYSPSAYFTDILNFLKTRVITLNAFFINNTNNPSKRRNDIPNIDLSCKNSNTPLPYIDLVNEQLELVTLNLNHQTTDPAVPLSFQTTGNAKDLAAYPEHTQKLGFNNYVDYLGYTVVYDKYLKKAVYPNKLPFQLALEESRVYFGHLGYTRFNLMNDFKSLDYNTVNDNTLLTEYNLLIEWLGISRNEACIISKNMGSYVNPIPYPYIGTAGTPYPYPNPYPAINNNTQTNVAVAGTWEFYGFPDTASTTWFNTLCDDISGLLSRCNITYNELLQLLVTDFLNKIQVANTTLRDFAIVAKPGEPVDTCIIDDLMLQYTSYESPPVSSDVAKKNLFDKLHRFVRLYRATGWSIYQLDIVLKSLSASDINVQVLEYVALTHQWCAKLNAPPEKVCVMWSDISIAAYINFNSDTQDNFPSLYDALFRNRSVINPPDPNFEHPNAIVGTVETNAGTILGALNITDADLALATDITAPTTLATLSKVYGLSLIVKAFQLNSFQEFFDIINLWSISIDAAQGGFFYTRIAKWKDILSAIDNVQSSKFDLYERIYIVQHLDPNTAYLPPVNEIQPFYENLRQTLNSQSQYDATGNITNQALLEEIVRQQFSAQLNIELDSSTYLLNEIVFMDVIPAILLLDVLVSKDFIKSTDDIVPGSSTFGIYHFDDIYKGYYKMDKIATIISRLVLSTPELKCFQTKNDKLNVIDFETITADITPVIANDVFNVQFTNLCNWVKVRDLLQLTKDQFISLLLRSIGLDENDAATTKNDWLSLVLHLTQWKPQDLQYLVGTGSVLLNGGILRCNYTPLVIGTNNYKDPGLMLQLITIMNEVNRTGLKPQNIFEALRPDIVMATSKVIRLAAKSKHSDENWLTIAKPLQDVLRMKQRDALVAYVLVQNIGGVTFKTENDLYAYLLIDTEMEPCMMTSRIKQGLCTLQLYIDRIILNLEKIGTTSIIMSEDLIAQWQSWRKWYRVWEANRKIFLYPENWIEPELRDDKTILFKAFESQLLQDEYNTSNVEEAYRIYLEGLDEIARLQPVSVYNEIANGADILHVIARTEAEPHKYYYRKQENGAWTTWEKIDVNIKSDHTSLVMWNGRLYFFWLTFQKVAHTNEEIGVIRKQTILKPYPTWMEAVGAVDGATPYATWNITLNWTSYLNGKWAKSDLSSDTMVIDLAKVGMNNAAKNSYNDVANAKKVLQNLTNYGEITNDEWFKNRIYLFTPFIGDTNDTGINFNLLFSAGLDENGIGLYCFHWKGDNSKEPVVIRDVDSGHQVIAPLGSRFDRMKFVEDMAIRDGRLRKDVKQTIPTGAGYFNYANNQLYIPNLSVDVRDPSKSMTILNATPGLNGDTTYSSAYKITARAPNASMHAMNPMDDLFFFEDTKSTFFVRKYSNVAVASQSNYTSVLYQGNIYMPSAINFNAQSYNINYQDVKYQGPSTGTNLYATETLRFYTFYHAQVPQFIGALNSNGIPGLLTLDNQAKPDTINFAATYQPTNLVSGIYPKDTVQLEFSDPYGIYNWELFFHAPMLVAQGLTNNQQFEEAQKWYHYIFNPTSNAGLNGANLGTNQRFWKFLPFYNLSATPIETLSQLLVEINSNVASAVAQVRKWESDPFNPHVIARMRIQAYMKNVLMKYLDNLIAWGDQLFSRDTIESINEATQLYILAANILGDRPIKIPPRVKKNIYTFNELIQYAGPLDALSNAMVNIESFYAPNAAPSSVAQPGTKDGRDGATLMTFYFCLPPNTKLLGYWDTIADRLFKIRNCRNIAGIVRQLPLYEPPIDPALLVRARAMGVSMDTFLNELYSAPAPYRFSYIIQKSNEFVADVKALGNSLLSAIEKKDAETLSLLRSSQEIQLLNRVTAIKQQQINDAQASLDALQKTKENTQIRYTYYSSRPFKNSNEQSHLDKLYDAMILGAVQGGIETAAGFVSALPTIHAQLIASGVSDGGLQLANVMRAASSAIGIKVGIDNAKGSMAVTTGGYERRRDDWVFQANTASKDLEAIDKQILGAQIKLDIANKELSNHLLQIDNAMEVDSFMRTKFSNAELYTWMMSQISTTYFQSYQLAYDLAKKAEKCYGYELPIGSAPIPGFIKFGYWDSLRKGLLSGENLQYDLRKMETTYMEENLREQELTKHFSLAFIDPEELLKLKVGGICNFDLDQVWYDFDYPSHYLRKIKSVSISIPCVAGPYTTVAAQLQLKSSQMQKNVALPFALTDIALGLNNNIISTSTAQNDAGLFELNFRDERYIPFENAGAISQWRLTLMPEETLRQFDYSTISDVIIHVKYTARTGMNEMNEQLVKDSLLAFLTTGIGNSKLPRYFSLKHEFNNDWYKGFNQLVTVDSFTNIGRQFTLTLDRAQFPEYSKGRKITIASTEFMIQPKNKIAGITYQLKYYPNGGTTGSSTVPLDTDIPTAVPTAITFDSLDIPANNQKPFKFVLYKKDSSNTALVVNEDELVDLFFIVKYTLTN